MRVSAKVAAVLLSMLFGVTAVSAQPWLGGGAAWHPFSYQDTQGQPAGIAVDIIREVMANTGQQMDFVFYPANRLNLLLAEGRLDLNYADSPQWNEASASERFVYSRPYLHVREYLYFLADHPSRHLPLQHLKDLRVGLVRGYRYPALEPALREGRLSKMETSQEATLIELLLLGRVDAIALVDDVFGNLLAHQQLDPARFQRSVKLSDAPLVIKLQREHAAQLPGLNKALKKLVDSGEVARIRNRYLEVPGNAVDQR